MYFSSIHLIDLLLLCVHVYMCVCVCVCVCVSQAERESFFFYYSMPHYMVILHALLNLIISFTFALNNKLYWMLFILVTSIIIF